MRSVLRYLTAALTLLCLAEITDLAWLSGARATITTTASKVVAAGNGSTTQWNFSFVGVSTADLIVSVTNSSGVTTVLTLTTQYSVTFTPQAPNSVWSVGGFVTYPLTGSPLALGNTLTIQRQVPYTQTTPFQNQGQFLPQAVETTVDLLTMQVQQLNTLFSGALVQPATDSQPLAPLPAAAARANNGLCFDPTGYIPEPCSVFPASSFLVSGTPLSGWVPIATSATTAVWGTTFPALMTFGTGLTGTRPWVQANVYAAGSTGTIVNAVRGSTASPNTDGVATAIVQSETNFNGTAPAFYASTIKKGLQGAMAGAYGIAAWGEAIDAVGGGSVSGGRWTASCLFGTLGNCTGATNVGVASVPYAYLIGAENQAWNLSGTDATTTFSAAKFAAAVLGSCATLVSPVSNKCDAGFMLNPNGTVPSIWGFLAPAGTVDPTGAAFRAVTSASLQQGLYVTQAPTGSSGFPVGNAMNLVDITSDNAALTGANFLNAFEASQVYGGVAMQGGRQSIAAFGNLSSPSSPSNANRNYVALWGGMVAASGDGGTNTGAGAQGAIFGGGTWADAQSGATNLLGVQGTEFNYSIRTGASAKIKEGIAVVEHALDAVAGASIDTAIGISGQSGAAGTADGILFTSAHGQQAVKSTGTLIGTDGGAFGIGIDLSASTFGTAFLKLGAGATVAAGAGTCPMGTVGGSTVQGCIVVNIAGTARNVPFF